MGRSARITVFVAAAIFVLAWSRLLVTTVTQASPARSVTFVNADGSAADQWTGPWTNCFGPAWVDGGDVWRQCDGGIGERSDPRLTRFDYAAGRATILPAMDTGDAHARGFPFQAGARDPQGGVVFVHGGRVLRVQGDAVEQLGDLGYLGKACVRFGDDRALEVAGNGPDGLQWVWRLAAGAWSHTKVQPLPEREGAQRVALGCRWDAPSRAWRFLWARFPALQKAGDTVELALWETSAGAAPVEVQRMSMAIQRGSDDDNARVFRSDDGRLFLRDGLLDRSHSGGAQKWMGRAALEWRDGRWAEPPLPPGAFVPGAGYDYVLADDGLHAQVGFETRDMERVGGSWYQLVGRPDLSLVELGPAPTSKAPLRGPGPPLASSFWLSNGFKMLPAQGGGYWLVGSLGRSYVRVDDATLARTDGLSFVERFGRAFVNDRAKRNSDFYFTLGFLRKLGFLWVLFGFLLTGAPALWWRRRRPGPATADRLVTALSVAYLVGCAISAPTFWQLSGVFW